MYCQPLAGTLISHSCGTPLRLPRDFCAAAAAATASFAAAGLVVGAAFTTGAAPCPSGPSRFGVGNFCTSVDLLCDQPAMKNAIPANASSPTRSTVSLA